MFDEMAWPDELSWIKSRYAEGELAGTSSLANSTSGRPDADFDSALGNDKPLFDRRANGDGAHCRACVNDEFESLPCAKSRKNENSQERLPTHRGDARDSNDLQRHPNHRLLPGVGEGHPQVGPFQQRRFP